jgi:hypothetical protein
MPIDWSLIKSSCRISSAIGSSGILYRMDNLSFFSKPFTELFLSMCPFSDD